MKTFEKFLKDLVYVWHKRNWLFLGVFVACLLGLAYALLTEKVYESQVLITPKDITPAPAGESILGRLGGGGNPFNNTALLARAETILQSRDLMREMVRRQDLMPVLFPEKWDEAQGRWREGAEIPTLSQAVDAFKSRLTIKSQLYGLTIQIKIRDGNAQRAHDWVKAYLDLFNARVREGLVRDATANKEFLERQLQMAVDPLMREKLQEAIVQQIQSGMMMNALSYELLESPEVPRYAIKPKRRMIVMVSFMIGLFGSTLALMLFRRFTEWNTSRVSSRVSEDPGRERDFGA